MAKFDSQLFDIGYMDTLAVGKTSLHTLDPRAKLVTTMVFIGTVVSFGKYDISALIPFVIFPIVLVAWGGLPTAYLIKKIMIVSPFAFFIGIFNPLIDQTVIMHMGSLHITGGWISFASILLRFALTVGAALVLISLTGFHAVCMGLEKLGVPRPFVVQLLFLYRYIFVLMDEAGRMIRARALRSFNSNGRSLKIFGSMIGHLLLRTMDRAQRIHLAMCCRGFDGHIRLIHPMAFGIREAAFVLGWSALFISMRLYNIPHILGKLVTEFVL
ncbi:MAG: cobalt ECF transporter T component CbiQ [Proteobacteria bacterium]|nr:cobalt ECF transporter T component CbiQ [Pseudomonadota bacterium]